MNKRLVAALLAGTAGLAAMAVAVPGIAAADAPQCSPAALAQARGQAAPQVAAFLSAHPDLAAELTKVKALPKDQRKAEWQSYRQANREEVRGFRTARQPVVDYRATCRH